MGIIFNLIAIGLFHFDTSHNLLGLMLGTMGCVFTLGGLFTEED